MIVVKNPRKKIKTLKEYVTHH